MERNSIFIEFLPHWFDIHDKDDFIIVLCTGHGSSVIDFVNCQKCTCKVTIEIN